jgi:hypothetical protein
LSSGVGLVPFGVVAAFVALTQGPPRRPQMVDDLMIWKAWNDDQ